MKRFCFFAMLSAIVMFSACSDDEFEPVLTIGLETQILEFPYEGDEQKIALTSNENWSVNDLPDWILIKVKDVPATRSTTYADGSKELTVSVEENPDYTERSTEIVLTSLSAKEIKIKVLQKKRPELTGYWILSEGYANSRNSEIAWYDVSAGELSKKQFQAINGNPLGDTGNDLKIYGSKMYCVVTGPGFGAAATEGTNYIEVIDPFNGKSIKRIPFTDAKGAPAKPREIVFENGKGYVSSYSNEVVRIDTATLALDGHAALSGTLPEGLCYHNDNIYVCNSGQGSDNKISVVDPEKMTETKVITTANNPTGIVSVSNDAIYFSTNYPEYKLYKMTTNDEKITEINGLSVGDMTYIADRIYTCSFDWDTYEGSANRFDPSTGKITKLNIDLESYGISMLMEYHIGSINGSEDIYLTGMGQDVVIVDPLTKDIKYAFETGVANGSAVVAVYK